MIRRSAGRTAAAWRPLPWLLLAVVGLYPLLVEWILFLASVRPPPEELLSFLTEIAENSAVVWIIALVAAPVLEELLFRGLLLRGLLRLQPAVAAIPLSAAVFAVLHANLFQLVPAFTAGLLFGWVYVKTGSLLLPITGHAFWNGQPLLAARLPWASLPAPGGLAGFDYAFPQQPPAWLGICAALAAASLLGLGRRLDAIASRTDG